VSATDIEKPRIVTFKIPPADHAELEMLAKLSERTVSAEIRLAIRAWLIEQSEYQRRLRTHPKDQQRPVPLSPYPGRAQLA
jgi:hypothetical protein